MKKKILLRSLLGAPLGIAVSYVITLLVSLSIGDGSFYPVTLELATDFGNEMNAVLVQTLCTMLYGAVFAGASVIWESESWSLLRMTATHLTVVSLVTLPVAWFMRWMPRNLAGVAVYFAIFLGIYAIIWLSQYSTMKTRIRQLNEKLRSQSK